jgi:O-antigen/teichoic acid export membrane protein
MTTSPPSFAGPAATFVAARLLNMAVSLAMIPLLIHYLGGRDFAAWAILLSCGAIFNELQFGMHTALVRAVAVAARTEAGAIRHLWSSAVGFLVCAHLVILPVVVFASEPLGEWLRLPSVGTWHPGAAILVVFLAVGLRAVLLTGSYVLFANGRFREVAALSLAQSFASNTAATLAAWSARDLATVLLSFWAGHLAVAGAGFLLATRTSGLPRPHFADRKLVRQLLGYGVKVQLSEWAQTINFQFDKFVIVRVLGLWPAALYEVSNRSVLALRSIPSSGMDTFLPVAARSGGGLPDGSARRMALLALYAMFIFFAAPLTVAPLFLFAWVGEMGYVSRHAFAFLIIGAAGNLLALPIATIAQAMGRPEIQARAAVGSILVNVPLSLVLVQVWGLNGAALGTTVAMLLGTAILFHAARGTLGIPVVTEVLSTFARHWPLLVVCIAWGAAVHAGFDHWITRTPAPIRYELRLRAMAAVSAGVLYCGLVVCLTLLKLRIAGLEREERIGLERLAIIARIPWPAAARPLPDHRRPEDAGDWRHR